MNEKTAHSLPQVMAALEALPCFDVPPALAVGHQNMEESLGLPFSHT